MFHRWCIFHIVIGLSLHCYSVVLPTAEAQIAADQSKVAVEQLGKLLEHDDLRVSIAAYHALEEIAKSKDSELGPAASSIVAQFQTDAKNWIENNASVFRNSRSMKANAQKSSDRWVKLDKPCFEVVFNDLDIEFAQLKYLAAVDIGYLAFVNMPKLKDEHLVVLNSQNLLFSLTLENTGVTGSGFGDLTLPSLQVIFLTGSPINDAGVRNLEQERFPVLTDMIVVDTDVTSAEIEKHQKANPQQVRIRVKE